jgi:hypothetical protein
LSTPFRKGNRQQFSHKATKAQRNDMIFKPLSKREESIAERIVDAAYALHIKLTGKRLGFLINFNVPLIKNSIK